MAMRSILHSSYSGVTPAPYGLYDLNARQYGDQLCTEEIARRKRVLGRFPTLSGSYDVKSFQDRDNVQFKRFLDDGEQRAKAPFRDEDHITDTISHFPTPAAESQLEEFRGHKPLVNTALEKRPGSTVPAETDLFGEGDGRKHVSRKFSPWSAAKEELLEDAGNSSLSRPGSKYPIDIVNDRELRDKGSTRAFYKTTTQRLYEGVDWSERVGPLPPPPASTYEKRCDLVTRRIRRYNDKAEPWQNLSKTPFSWDYQQSRRGDDLDRPLSFISENRKGEQIPNYTGIISGEGEKDVAGAPFVPFAVVRSANPKYVETGRRGYIPGYQGCTNALSSAPPLSQERQPRAESTARAHRPLSYPWNQSKYSHRSPISNMVSLSHPFNPNNATEPPLGTTASGLRVR